MTAVAGLVSGQSHFVLIEVQGLQLEPAEEDVAPSVQSQGG